MAEQSAVVFITLTFGHLGGFHLLATGNNAAVKIYVRVIVWTQVFISLVLFLFPKYLGVESLGCMVVLCLTFGGTDSVFHSGCTVLHPHHRCARVPVSPYPH